MSTLRWSPSLLLAAALASGLAGCGGSSTLVSKGPAASHGGLLLELKNGAGFVELLFERADAKAKASTKGKVVAYFMSQDGTGPSDPAPTDVTFTDEKGKPLPLTSKPEGGSGPSRFESEPVTLPSGIEPSGKLEAKLGGDSVVLDTRPR